MMNPSSENHIQAILDELVARGVDDWVQLAELDDLIKRYDPGYEVDENTRIKTGIEVINRAIERGLMEPGDVSDQQGGFTPWKLDREAAAERIEHGWAAVGSNLDLGEVCWLANTKNGDIYAEEVRQRVEARTPEAGDSQS